MNWTEKKKVVKETKPSQVHGDGSWQLAVVSCQLAIESRVLRLSALGFGIWFLVFGPGQVGIWAMGFWGDCSIHQKRLYSLTRRADGNKTEVSMALMATGLLDCWNFLIFLTVPIKMCWNCHCYLYLYLGMGFFFFLQESSNSSNGADDMPKFSVFNRCQICGLH